MVVVSLGIMAIMRVILVGRFGLGNIGQIKEKSVEASSRSGKCACIGKQLAKEML